MRSFACVLFVAFLFISCKKDHSGGGGQMARGSLQSVDGNCLPATVHGSWTAGLANGADSSYVDISVHVTSPGSYHIVSDSSNGVQFSDSGAFVTTGLQTVRLKAKGIFTAPTGTGFTISFDNSQCGFFVSVDSLPAVSSNQWRFTANGHLYQGTTEGHVWFLPQQLGAILEYNEEVFNSPDTVMVLEIVTPYDSDMGSGSYTCSRCYVTAGPDLILNGMPFDDERAKIIVTLTGAIWPPPGNTRQITGTFEGTAVDARTHEVVRITNGAFHVGT